MNPLVPTSYDVVWSLVVLVSVALVVVALVSLGRARDLGRGQALLWAVLILLVPILGAAAWLIAGQRITQPPDSLEA